VLIRLILFTYLLFSSVYSKEYPHTFKQLGTPLYKSIEYWSNIEDNISFKQEIKEFNINTQEILLIGYTVDKVKDKKSIKSYLKKLRKLQKSYEKLLYKLHQKIMYAVETDDTKLFFRLTKYPFEGLLKNSNLRKMATTFYREQRSQHKSTFFEKIIHNDKLIEDTQELFAAEIVNSSYNSQSKTRVKKSVDVSATRTENSIKISFYNTNSYPITIGVKAKYNALDIVPNVSNEFVIKAKSSVLYATLKIKGAKASYNYSWHWIMGSKNVQHTDTFLYTLPYKKGSAYMVSQGYNGTKTHKGTSAYSIDFAMPIGTKVYAARKGTVVKLKDDSAAGGYDKKYASSGNYVRIMHIDGTFATYYHLKQRGVLVSIGQKVSQGEALGYSGNTGYSSGPHLHFSVFKVVDSTKRVTIPIKILSADGVVLEPKIGHYYKAK